VSDRPNSIRILAVDDHPLFRNGIAALLEHQPDMKLVGEASNGREAVQQFRAHRPDMRSSTRAAQRATRSPRNRKEGRVSRGDSGQKHYVGRVYRKISSACGQTTKNAQHRQA